VTIFDLLFLACVFATAITLTLAVIFALRGRGAKALRIVRAYGIGAVAYLAIALGVDFFKPQRVLAVGAPWCLDDWCLQVESASRATDGPKVTYDIKLRIFSTARGITQRANGAWLYLIDERGHRYAANFDPSAVPLTVQLGPGQSVTTSQKFEVPGDVGALGLITGHGGPYCGAMSLLIIGEGGCLFNRPTLVRVN
jgi:hypothetical protein